MKTRSQVLAYLILFAVLDLVVPFPITAVILIYALVEKPPWFKELVDEIYQSKGD